MKRYEYLAHTADAKFRAYGNTMEEAFCNAAQAMFNIICDTSGVKPASVRRFSIHAKKVESLLYDFLEEFLFLLDTEGVLLSKIKKITIKRAEGGYCLECSFSCDHYKNYEVKGNIKSITYSDMMVEKIEKGYMIQAVVDL